MSTVDEKKRFYIKIHEHEGKLLLAVCDPNILGRERRKGDVVISVPQYFYQGREASLEEVIDLIREADMVVVTGRRIIEELIKAGIVDEESVLKLDEEFWHVQILKEVIR